MRASPARRRRSALNQRGMVRPICTATLHAGAVRRGRARTRPRAKAPDDRGGRAARARRGLHSRPPDTPPRRDALRPARDERVRGGGAAAGGPFDRLLERSLRRFSGNRRGDVELGLPGHGGRPGPPPRSAEAAPRTSCPAGRVRLAPPDQEDPLGAGRPAPWRLARADGREGPAAKPRRRPRRPRAARRDGVLLGLGAASAPARAPAARVRGRGHARAQHPARGDPLGGAEPRRRHRDRPRPGAPLRQPDREGRWTAERRSSRRCSTSPASSPATASTPRSRSRSRS